MVSKPTPSNGLLGDCKLLVLLKRGKLLIYSYKDMEISLEKESDNLDFNGQITAVGCNVEKGILAINLFSEISGDNSEISYINSLRFYRLKLENWIWLEFLEEKDSNINSSKPPLP